MGTHHGQRSPTVSKISTTRAAVSINASSGKLMTQQHQGKKKASNPYLKSVRTSRFLREVKEEQRGEQVPETRGRHPQMPTKVKIYQLSKLNLQQNFIPKTEK